MSIDYTVKWVPLPSGTPFTFNPPYKEESWGEDRIIFRLPTADTPGDGEYSGDGTGEPRTVVIGGLLIGETPEDLRDKWDALCVAIRPGTLGKLYKSSDRFLYCRLTSLTRPRDTGLEYTDWEMVFRASDPLYYSSAVFDADLELSGDTLVPIGGSYPAVPSVILTVSGFAPGGTITVTQETDGVSGSFLLRPSATGVYTIDSAAGTVLRGITDAIGEFSGEYFEEVGPTDATISIATAGGATISAASLQWRKRYTGA